MTQDRPAPLTAENTAAPGARDMPHHALALYAHELRGALTIIAGYTDLMRLDLTETERVAALDGIERAIRRADELCSDALAGRAPMSERKRSLERVSLFSLAEEVAADLRTATGRTVEVSRGSRDVVIVGERGPLTRALANVVANALKYSPAPEPVEVRVALEDSLTLGRAGVVEVADRGPGIPAEERSRIFEPFQRLERDEEKPGTGLGLVIVRDVVEAHDGVVEVQDRPGGGAIVRIELPAEG